MIRRGARLKRLRRGHGVDATAVVAHLRRVDAVSAKEHQVDNSGVRGQVGKSWVRGTLDELESTLGPERAASLVGKMMAVIPAGYDELNWPKTAALG